MPCADSYRLKKLAACLLGCFFLLSAQSQQISSKNSCKLSIKSVDKDSTFDLQSLKLISDFPNAAEADQYISKIPSILSLKGFPFASVDSIFGNDSIKMIYLYLGQKINRLTVNMASINAVMPEFTGYDRNLISGKSFSLQQLQALQNKIIDQCNRSGYPFAAVHLDSVMISGDNISGKLMLDKGPAYNIDSIRLWGKPAISKKFLQHYLNISNHSLYNSYKLKEVDKKMLQLPYLSMLQPSDVTMLGSGGILNLYLKPKKNSFFNFLIGFLPTATTTGKVQLTGDVNLDLKNSFGTGERLLLKWQQLQPKSPRLNIGYHQPYVFNLPVGFDGLFDLFKKDSNFIQTNAQLGLQHVLSSTQSGKIFFQWQNTILLSGAIDTALIKSTKQLPPNIDFNAVTAGIDYTFNNTNYPFNPRSGNELVVVGSAGIKKFRPNNDIAAIKEPGFNYATLYDSLRSRNYQLRIKISAAHYFPTGKNSTIKASFNGAAFISPNIFRNELFQIGGYRLLRGFDEEGIYATRYAVLSAEYRLLLALNSYLCFFTDMGFTKNNYQTTDINNRFTGAGAGIVYETKSGLLNLSFALGKRNDLKFDVRNAAKIHFGYINYF